MEIMQGVKGEPKIVQTDIEAQDGQNKCPRCGATDIALNAKTGLLRCNYCRYEFLPEKVKGLETNISEIRGEIIGSGAKDIDDSENQKSNVKTFKCSSCGAEVVIDGNETTQARCHWCRNTLSLNSQIPNGAIPDVLLPFKLTKEEAKTQIEEFVGKRKFYAHPKFKEEFSLDNIMGVYFPYMLVDVNGHAHFEGYGEHEVRKYFVRRGDSRELNYDADLYEIERDFDLSIQDISVESNSDRLNKENNEKTNNVINSIMPFDTENCVRYNANYLKGYTSEKRDTNIEDLRKIVDVQSKDISRFAANDTIKKYDRGVNWKKQELDVKGRQWKTAYLPVWLYSYQEKKEDKSIMHYVAVNARTKETMGSVPIHIPKLIGMSALVELLGIILMLIVDVSWSFLFAMLGFIYFLIVYLKYRNTNARHHHEIETKRNIINLRQKDQLIKHKTGLSNSKMVESNNMEVTGQNVVGEMVNKFTSML